MQVKPLVQDRSLPVSVDMPLDLLASQVEWASSNSADIQAQAGSAGAILLRGCALHSADDFRAICAAVEPDLRNYAGGDSPRTGVADKVYTSTEYDPTLEVFLHNELSYAGWSPRLVFFGCLQTSASSAL